jgi:hypothetical protein
MTFRARIISSNADSVLENLQFKMLSLIMDITPRICRAGEE